MRMLAVREWRQRGSGPRDVGTRWPPPLLTTPERDGLVEIFDDKILAPVILNHFVPSVNIDEEFGECIFVAQITEEHHYFEKEEK